MTNTGSATPNPPRSILARRAAPSTYTYELGDTNPNTVAPIYNLGKAGLILLTVTLEALDTDGLTVGTDPGNIIPGFITPATDFAEEDLADKVPLIVVDLTGPEYQDGGQLPHDIIRRLLIVAPVVTFLIGILDDNFDPYAGVDNPTARITVRIDPQ